MLLKLVFVNKKLFYKIKTKKDADFWVATAPYPKNKRQKKQLIEFLSPFEKRIIYPQNFCTKDYPEPYPAFEIMCKNMLLNFLDLCKKKRPEIAVIAPNGLIKNNFYFDLSKYVGQIVLITSSKDQNLKRDLLAHNGTVIEFLLGFEKNKTNAEYLYMPKNKSFIF